MKALIARLFERLWLFLLICAVVAIIGNMLLPKQFLMGDMCRAGMNDYCYEYEINAQVAER